MLFDTLIEIHFGDSEDLKFHFLIIIVSFFCFFAATEDGRGASGDKLNLISPSASRKLS